MVSRTGTIDHSSPLAKKQFDRIVGKWRNECIRSVVSPRAWREKGRTLRRELKRRKCHVDEQEYETSMVISFLDKGSVKGKLTITFENYEPVPS